VALPYREEAGWYDESIPLSAKVDLLMFSIIKWSFNNNPVKVKIVKKFNCLGINDDLCLSVLDMLPILALFVLTLVE
jgi:hypothetical protein